MIPHDSETPYSFTVFNSGVGMEPSKVLCNINMYIYTYTERKREIEAEREITYRSHLNKILLPASQARGQRFLQKRGEVGRVGQRAGVQHLCSRELV